LLLNVYKKQLFITIREAQKSRQEEGGKVNQVCYIKTTILDDPLRRKEVSFDSNKPGFSSQEHVVRSMSRRG
jgi:hypothetical protein